MKTRISDQTRLARKLGIGEGSSYKSFIKRRDFSSNSRVHEITGQIVRRPYVLLSDLEKSFFSYFDFCFGKKENIVSDIREQYPLLPLSRTQSIAEQCNIRHPRNENSKDVIMTTDLVLTIQRGDRQETIAISIKPSSKFSKRTLEKMELEKRYWNEQDIRWVLITEKQKHSIVANNVAFLRDHFSKNSIDIDYSAQILDKLRLSLKSNLSIDEFLSEFCHAERIPKRVGRRSFYHLLANRKVRFDYTKSFNFHLPLKDLAISPQ